MKKLIVAAVALLLYACGGDSSSSSEEPSINIREDALMDIVDSEYESGDLTSVSAYDSDSGDSLYFKVADFDEDKNRYYLVDEATGDTVVAKVGKGVVKVIEIIPNSEKSSDDDDDDDDDSSSKNGKSSSAGKDNRSSSSTKDYLRSSGSVEPPPFSIVVENEEMRFDLSKMKMVDKRDGHEYGLRLDSTTLSMSTNLNYKVKDSSWCYNDYEKNCERYGRLYSWFTTYRETSRLCSTRKLQGICPLGWLVSEKPVEGLFSGYRDEDGYYLNISRMSWAWLPTAPETMAVEQTCGDNYRYTNRICVDLTCTPSTFYSDRMRKGDAIPVTCVYQWPVEVPDSVELPKSSPTPKHSAPAELSPYKGTFGEVIDDRDGNIYKTVDIGSQTWMAENLRYVIDSSFCMGGNSVDSCGKYEHLGRMYQWYQANGLGEYKFNRDTIDWPVQGVCPNGWHIPTMSEWKTLFNYVLVATDGYYLGKALYATQWDASGVGGMDAFGFGMISAGHKHHYDIFYDYGFGYVEYMISDERETPNWEVRFAGASFDEDGGFYYDTDNAYYSYPHIRCIKGKGSHAVLPPKTDEPSEP